MPKNKGGRPLKEISKIEFEKLCALQCTKEEICGWFDTTDKTLENWCQRTYDCGFSEIFRQKRGAGKISLRRHQFKLAEKNASMAIFLGKQYLGQTDKIETVNNTTSKVSMDFSKLSTDEIKAMLDNDI